MQRTHSETALLNISRDLKEVSRTLKGILSCMEDATDKKFLEGVLDNVKIVLEKKMTDG